MRDRKPDSHNRVTYVELFFDLVFVFAITQISHFLLAHFHRAGPWLDPEQTVVRLMLFALMALGVGGRSPIE